MYSEKYTEKQYDELRERQRADSWSALEKKLGADGAELVDALKELYTAYSGDVVKWFAGLYDPNFGAYYFSASARDNDEVLYDKKMYKLLPDVESTCQAMGFWNISGLAGDADSYAESIPDWMKKKMVGYVLSLQDPDGYFYHPQWGREARPSRLSRDFNWSMSILKKCGAEPKYKTILNRSTGTETKKTRVPEHLASKEAFTAYLDNLRATQTSWYYGNDISSQASQINACGLRDVCLDWLNGIQNPENGCWEEKSNYTAVNGFLKISSFYNDVGAVINYPMEAAKAAIDAITSDQPMSNPCDLFNTWLSVENIIRNLRTHGGEEGKKQADEIVKMLWRIAPAGVRKSREKVLIFKKELGSFSYKPDASSTTSQGMPVSIPNSPEGDINATFLCTVGVIDHVFKALDLDDYRVPLLTESDRERYISLLEARRDGLWNGRD